MAGRSGVLPSTPSRNKTQTCLPPLAAIRYARCTLRCTSHSVTTQATVYQASEGGDITPLLTYIDDNVRCFESPPGCVASKSTG